MNNLIQQRSVQMQGIRRLHQHQHRRNAQEKLMQERMLCRMDASLLQNFLEAVPFFAYVIDVGTFSLLFANANTRSITSGLGSELCYRRLFGLDQPCPYCPLLQGRDAFQDQQYSHECFVDREQKWFTVRALLFRFENNKEVCLIVATPRLKQTERESVLESLAYTDELTGIANNRRYEEIGPALIQTAARAEKKLAVIALKLDGLHRINSVQGYAQGDAVLRDLTRAITHLIPDRTLFARCRGNDFILIYPLRKGDEAEDLDVLMRHLEQAIIKTGLPANKGWLKLSAGVSLYPEHGKAFETLNRKARQAIAVCRHEKSPFACACYDDELMRRLRDSESLQLDLAIAVRRNEMSLVFQPKYGISAGRIVGAEALIRWNHPSRGLLSPDVFIPLAEKSLTISPIDNWVINAACREWKRVLEECQERIPLSINISPQKFYQPDLLDLLTQAVTTHGLSPNELEIELTERTALEDIDKAVAIMARIRRHGFRVSIDDFGTGYSSLNYLQALPFDVVKLDRTFVVDSSPRARAVLCAIVNLIKVYDAQVVFEGVETEDQFLFARLAGCDLVQGYYTGKPMTGQEFSTALKETIIKALPAGRHSENIVLDF